MHPLLQQLLCSFGDLSKEENALLGELMVTREVSKGTVLVRQGEVCQECFFVLKGCLRQYRLVDGVEHSLQFYTENQAVTLFTSYTCKTPSDSSLVSLEDACVLVGEPERDARLFEQFPQLENITRSMMAQDLGKVQDALSAFRISSPEERYLELLNKRPELLQRVPQHQLASYIGVTPESLSRIRKRLLKS